MQENKLMKARGKVEGGGEGGRKVEGRGVARILPGGMHIFGYAPGRRVFKFFT